MKLQSMATMKYHDAAAIPMYHNISGGRFTCESYSRNNPPISHLQKGMRGSIVSKY